MPQIDEDELWGRSRTLFIDLLKLGLSLSTGIIAALSLLVFDKGKVGLILSADQAYWYNWALIALTMAATLAILAWLAQAFFYSAWAFNFPKKGVMREVWLVLRTVFGIGFAVCFIGGVAATAQFIKLSVNVIKSKPPTVVHSESLHRTNTKLPE